MKNSLHLEKFNIYFTRINLEWLGLWCFTPLSTIFQL